MRLVFELLVLMCACGSLFGQNKALLQIAHASADIAIPKVDVYVNSVLMFDNLSFKSATNFIPLDAGKDQSISIAPEASTSVVQSFYTTTVNFATGSRHILFTQGALNPAEYSPNPDPESAAHEFTLFDVPDILDKSSKPDYFNVFFYNAGFDAPKMDIYQAISKAAGGISFGSIGPYFTAKAAVVQFGLAVSGSQPFSAYGGDLKEYANQSVVLVACGFISPAANQSGPLLSLFIVPQTGGTFKPLIPGSVPPLCKVQFINASADPDVKSVDIYWNDELVIDNLDTRMSTPYYDYYQLQNSNVAVAPASSTSSADAFSNVSVSLTAGRHSIIIAGVGDPTKYPPNPDSQAASMKLSAYHLADISPSADSPTDVDFQIFHATADLQRASLTGPTMLPEISYGQVTGKQTIVASETVFEINTTADSKSHGRFVFRFPQFAGGSFVTVLYGFDQPQFNNNGPSLSVLTAPPTGGPLVNFPNVLTSVFQSSSLSAQSIATVFYDATSNCLQVCLVDASNEILTMQVSSLLGESVQEFFPGKGLSGFGKQVAISTAIFTHGAYVVQVNTTLGSASYLTLVSK
ncbi:MAG: DUF4397 domain-containing protein [Ignavibacteria bacterium]|nr:DUF4397 domain-containing protein [Ignavibacteria bacterium]